MSSLSDVISMWCERIRNAEESSNIKQKLKKAFINEFGIEPTTIVTLSAQKYAERVITDTNDPTGEIRKLAQDLFNLRDKDDYAQLILSVRLRNGETPTMKWEYKGKGYFVKIDHEFVYKVKLEVVHSRDYC